MLCGEQDACRHDASVQGRRFSWEELQGMQNKTEKQDSLWEALSCLEKNSMEEGSTDWSCMKGGPREAAGAEWFEQTQAWLWMWHKARECQAEAGTNSRIGWDISACVWLAPAWRRSGLDTQQEWEHYTSMFPPPPSTLCRCLHLSSALSRRDQHIQHHNSLWCSNTQI